MTTLQILELYGIAMENRIITVFGKREVFKSITGGNQIGHFFCDSFDDIESLENDVIAIVQHFIDGNNPPFEEEEALLDAINSFAIIRLDGVSFYYRNSIEIVQSVSLDHFNVIAKAWRDFLLQPPLKGTVV